MKLLEELRRRNVLRASIAYVITAWVVVESASLLLEIFAAPAWVAQTIVIMLVAGFPVAMVFAWMFEITPEGLKPDNEVDAATAAGTGRYLVMLSVVMTMVAPREIIGIAYAKTVAFFGVFQPCATTARR